MAGTFYIRAKNVPKKKAEKCREQAKRAKSRRLMHKLMQVKSTKSKGIWDCIEYSTLVAFKETDIEAIYTIPEHIEPPAQICVNEECALIADIVIFISRNNRIW